MIDAIFIERNPNTLESIRSTLSIHFPQVEVTGCFGSTDQSLKSISKAPPDMAFVELEDPVKETLSLIRYLGALGTETILVSEGQHLSCKVVNQGIAGYILKPVDEEDLENAVQNALGRISLKSSYNRVRHQFDEMLTQVSDSERIGIPTLEGFEFLAIRDIIRCEGLQRCTRIVTQNASSLVSAYNLGEFKKLLEPHHFFAPHKSHLINLRLVKSYHREGYIVMADGSMVPVARRQKAAFLGLFKHP